jgi:2-oxoglutarate ferredoxin oxidoreductase subunit beta
MKLETNIINTWCPGCGNFGILQAIKLAINDLISQGVSKDKIVLVSDIGCNSKIVDYLNINSFYSLHGRSIPTALGIKLANPELKIIVSLGDGAALDEGISHLIHSAKRNSNITVIMHNNRLFALTTGQFTAVSAKGMKLKSTPHGSIEEPLNPLELMLASNATFISRGYSAKLEHLRNLIISGINHQGFSFIEVMQPCVSFFNNIQFLNERCYEVINESLESKEKALDLIKEWNYNEEGRIPLGIFYKKEKSNFEEEASKHIEKDKKVDIEKCLKTHF